MVALNYTIELPHINSAKKFLSLDEINYENLGTSAIVDLQTRMWYNSRKKSLLIGSCEDELVLFYHNENFNFGINLLLWDNWYNMLSQLLKTISLDEITSTTYVDGIYCIGAWVRRQDSSFSKLSAERKYKLYTIGIKKNYFKKSIHIQYNNKDFYTYEDFIKYQNLSIYELFKKITEGQTLQEICINYGATIIPPAYKSNPQKPSYANSKILPSSIVTDNSSKRPTSPGNILDFLLNNIDMEKTRDNLRKLQLEEIERKKQEEKKLLETQQIRLNAFKLQLELFGNTKDDIKSLFHFTTTNYITDIKNGYQDPMLSHFDRHKLKKLYASNYLKWGLYEIGNTSDFSIAFFTFITIKDIKNNAVKIKQLILEIQETNNEYNAGFFCNEEEYIALSNDELDFMLSPIMKDIIKRFHKLLSIMKYGLSIDTLYDFFN